MKIKLFGMDITINRAEGKEHFAEVIRKNYEKGVLGKVEAVREIKLLFQDTDDKRSTLRAAVDYMDRKIKV